MRLLSSLVILLALATPALAQGGMVVGYNQGWIEGKYGRDLTSAFDENDWRKMLVRTRESGGSALRMWLFEGQPCDGVVYDGHKPVGVEPSFLANVRRVCELAKEEGVKVYWTGFDGNYFGAPSGLEFDRRWNYLNDKYSFGTAFLTNVLGPVLDVIKERPDACYAFDVMNEVQGSMHWNFWPDGWEGARRFMSTWTAFVHGRAPGLKVTVSSGWGNSTQDILAGRFDGLGFDFLDVHIYSDATTIKNGAKLAAHARSKGLPIVLGEFGQEKKTIDPQLQARITRGILEDGKRLGFAAVFAWRLVDEQEHDKRLSYWDGETPRPAVAVVKELAPPVVRPPTCSSGLVKALGGKRADR